MASSGFRIASWAITATVLAALAPAPCLGASYSSRSWFLTGAIGFQVVNPADLNNELEEFTATSPKLNGLIYFGFEIERGLREPDFSHWIQFGYHLADVSATVANGTAVSHSTRYFSVIPVGLTYWFARTAYIDFGIGLGGGFGLSPSFEATSTEIDGSESTLSFGGKLSPIVESRLTARLWLGAQFAVSLNGALRLFSTDFEETGGGTVVKASLTSLTGSAGVTWAIGGVKGTGRAFVEVIPAGDARKQRKLAPLPPEPKGETPFEEPAESTPEE